MLFIRGSKENDMTEITSIIDFIKDIGFVGILVILAIPALRSKLGFGGDNISSGTIDAMKEAFTYDKPDRPALIARIPFICNDIKQIKEDLSSLEQGVSFIKGKLDV